MTRGAGGGRRGAENEGGDCLFNKKWHVHVASAFPLAHYYRAVLGYG